MIKEKLQKNYPFSLPVWEGEEEVLIGSEVEPKLLGETEETTSWNNGPARYHRVYTTRWYMVVQKGRPYIVESRFVEGDFLDGAPANKWEAYEVPSTIRIDRAYAVEEE